ncbi:MAG: 4Fe-4S dicluster domain-containing protein [Thermodesulfovibrionales bacterium]
MIWRRYRRIVEYIQAIIIIGLPFLKVKGESALRFDITTLKLHFFGTAIWINEFYLFLVAVIFLLLLIISITTALGRIWCGWVCPQTVLLDLTGDVSGSISKRSSGTIQKIILFPVSALVSLTLIWYFIPPYETIQELFVSRAVTGFFLVQWIVIYAELAFLGRTFCTTICPYSMLQSGLFDKDTLVIAYDRSMDDICMDCHKCSRVCPVGIDIKEGIRRECIACAECIDTCRSMTKMVGKSSFIGYTGKILRPKAFILGGTTAIIGVIFIMMVYMRPGVDLVIARDAEQPTKNINRYTYTIQNNSDRSVRLNVSIKGDFILIGDNAVDVKPFSLIHGRLMVRPTGSADKVIFILKGDGITLEREAGYL